MRYLLAGLLAVGLVAGSVGAAQAAPENRCVTSGGNLVCAPGLGGYHYRAPIVVNYAPVVVAPPIVPAYSYGYPAYSGYGAWYAAGAQWDAGYSCAWYGFC